MQSLAIAFIIGFAYIFGFNCAVSIYEDDFTIKNIFRNMIKFVRGDSGAVK